MSKMMKDLRIKDGVIDSKNDEIRGLKREMDERVYRAREEHDREWQVGVVCDSYICVCECCLFRIVIVFLVWRRVVMIRVTRCVVFVC